MIVFAENKHITDITKLWCEAFGDREEDVLVYLNTLIKYCVVFEDNGKVAGMLFLLPVTCGINKGRYVYAVATLKSYRGRGISTALLGFAKMFIAENNESFLVLVPQTKSLFDFYGKRGFKAFSCVNKINVSCLKKGGNFDFKKVFVNQYFQKRKEYLADMSFVEWDVEMLQFAKNMYDGDFFRIDEDGKEIGIAFVTLNGDEIVVKEVLSTKLDRVIKAIQSICCTQKRSIVYPDKNREPFAMMYPNVYADAFFNIALD